MNALRKIRKALGALLGGATGAAVVEVAEAFDLSVDPTLAGAIAVILAAAGAWLAPPNDSGAPLLDVALTALRRLGHDPRDVSNIEIDGYSAVVNELVRDDDGEIVREPDPDGHATWRPAIVGHAYQHRQPGPRMGGPEQRQV